MKQVTITLIGRDAELAVSELRSSIEYENYDVIVTSVVVQDLGPVADNVEPDPRD